MIDRLTELAKIWLDKSKNNLEWAKDSFQDGHFGSTCFVCQQTAELALKSYLFFQRQKLIRTHNLPSLNEVCKKFDQEFSELNAPVRILNNYYTDTRYPDIWDYSRFEDKKLAEEAIKLAERAVNFVSKKVKV